MRRDDFRSVSNELISIRWNRRAEGMECWRRKRCRVYRECREGREII